MVKYKQLLVTSQIHTQYGARYPIKLYHTFSGRRGLQWQAGISLVNITGGTLFTTADRSCRTV